MQEIHQICVNPNDFHDVRCDRVLRFPRNKVLFWLKSPYMLWFLGVKDAILGCDLYGRRIYRWEAVKDAWRMMVETYRIRKE